VTGVQTCALPISTQYKNTNVNGVDITVAGETSRVFRCPAYHDPTTRNATSGYRLSYSANPFYMPCDGEQPYSNPPGTPYYHLLRKRGSAKRTGEIILIGDGSVLWDGSHMIYNADAYYFQPIEELTATWLGLFDPANPGNDNNSPVANFPPGTNDTTTKANNNNWNLVSWRHYQNKGANFLFLDGHVESRFLGKNFLYKNVRHDL
jgi:prepilin-type processing-associated H-X9-DG protein